MLKEHSRIFLNILFLIDLASIAISWTGSYYLRFYSGLLPAPSGAPEELPYLLAAAPVALIWGLSLKGFGLYRPRRLGNRASETLDIAKASLAATLVLVAVTFFVRQYEFSRMVIVIFFFLGTALLGTSRYLFREVLRYIRKRGFNIKRAIVAGTGAPARVVIERLEGHPEVGIEITGVVTGARGDAGSRVFGVEVIGDYNDLGMLIKGRCVDILFIALSWNEHSKVMDILKSLSDETVDIMVVPDLYEFITLGGGVEEFDGLPVLNLQNTTIYGWNKIVKRGADIVIASILLALTSPLMVLLAVLVKATSPGPVLYRQERMSIGGDTFKILKFRSMWTGAEGASGAVWAGPGDPRRTRIGAFLRRTSLDELPQLINVLRGDMSLVGPRPERPVFIEEFRKNVPRYMLRHKMKAGITGWAQVNGWRGNTDLKKRVEHDLYYIEHWSFIFDVKILWLTLWKGLINRNAY
ncbi:MAG: undecaprenyl-phosphate glucose phosphotransferase [Thermodesulfobacteriota bacterium]